ncbi:hypothetical protein LOC71_09060 [Rhodopirellula sp. JC740]|uniref:Uncharacterized protein n=1 Tax=Rhodopirellula halodulae TaxID=2894198 RepID=A0ABS8NFU8_9BACT|nr:hypothetical protein [Rhodopirellula sp. JC740]MCC9642421.1 hypothetical protein [Rhodopirellula sp. JC740]
MSVRPVQTGQTPCVALDGEHWFQFLLISERLLISGQSFVCFVLSDPSEVVGALAGSEGFMKAAIHLAGGFQCG